LKIIDLHLAGLGRKEIAQELGMTPQGVGLVLLSPLAQEELARRRGGIERKVDQEVASAPQRARALLEQATLRAAETHVELLESENERVRQTSATEILKQVYGEGGKSQGAVTVINVEQLQLLQVALKESEGVSEGGVQGTQCEDTKGGNTKGENPS
jgi:hypothetical protein